MPLNPSQEIGENVMITDISQLQSITPQQAKKIKSLRIENQDINMDFLDFFLSLGDLDSLYFYRCEIYSATLSCLNSAEKLGVVGCNLTSDLASSVLPIQRWDYIETLDLSHNKLALDPKQFYDWLYHSIIGAVSIGTIIISDNGFSEEWKDKIKSYFKNYTNVVV